MKVIIALFLGTCCFLPATATLHAQESNNAMPEKARQELGFMVGNWKSQLFEKGKQTGHAIHSRQWTEGKECMLFTSSGESNGAPISATGISGWNAKAEAIVEHWYMSSGVYLYIEYPLAKMTDKEWNGTSRVVNADGTVTEGPVRLEKGDDEWSFTASWNLNGEKGTIRNETKRIQQER